MKVLIVDDDHLVRKGIISLMPWSEFGLQVTGEAENGKKALQFLEEHPVDLLISDIAMPSMSGIDLIREVRKKHPNMWIVVLTFHQDFEYVQEALRLGAIDYIAKVELEKENMSDILGRITARIREEQPKRSYGAGSPPHAVEDGQDDSDKALLFISLVPGQSTQVFRNVMTPEQFEQVYELNEDAWLLSRLQPMDESAILQQMYEVMQLQGEWAVAKVSKIGDEYKKQLYKLLGQYLARDFFYEYTPEQSLYEASMDRLGLEEEHHLKEKELYALQQRWSSLDWVYDEDCFHGLLAELAAIRPTASKLESMFYSAMIHWERYTSESLGHLFETARLRFWVDWADWVRDMRIRIRSKFMQSQYSDEVMCGVMKAVDYINHNLSMDLKLTEVAGEVHISRSYFSESFKNIMGKTFNEYIRDARIEYAASLLCQTNDPIYKIAEKCGYPDEKYFSRIFRRKVGQLPSEVRKSRDRVTTQET